MNKWSHIEHHGHLVWVRADLEGKHREHCLCHTPCEKFHPNEPNNCPIAEAVYGVDVKYHLVTPVWECPEFEPRADRGEG